MSDSATDTATDAWMRTAVNRARLDSAALVWVCVDGKPVGAVLLRDPLRGRPPGRCGGCAARGSTAW